MIPAISLFSSAGFMDEAFFMEGFSIRAQVEIDPWRRQVLACRFPRAKQFEDVHHVGRHNLPAKPAIIFGGFPCQPVSGAGQRKGTADERWLWPEFARIIGELRPRVVFLENADEIGAPIKSDGTIVSSGPALEVIASLTALGYDARWGIVSAASAGAPHQRDRWWCIAWNVTYTNATRFCNSEHEQSSFRDERQSVAQDHSDQSGIRSGLEVSDSVVGANGGLSNSDQIGRGWQQTAAIPVQDSDWSQRNPSIQGGEWSAEFHSIEPGSPGVALGDTHPLSISQIGAVGQQVSSSQFGAQESQGSNNPTEYNELDEPDLGRIVFDGIASRLDRLASTQLYAAPLGLQPYPFEPVRLTDDNYDWKARVEAIGDAVCIPVVRAFAAGIREGLRAQDAAIRERRGKTKE